MNRKKIIGTSVLIVGAVLFIFALIATQKINKAKGDVEGISHFLPNNREGGAVKSFLGGKASAYDNLVRWSYICGIILVVAGAGSLIYYRKK